MSTNYLKYTCINTEPLSIADVYNSKSDEAAAFSYITGASIRGAVMNILASKDSKKLEKYKRAFFDGTLRFLNAYPALCKDGSGTVLETIPVPKGFYEDRKADKGIVHVFCDNDGQKIKGKKRAKAGKMAALGKDKDQVLFFMSPKMGETFKIRLARNDETAGTGKQDNKTAGTNKRDKEPEKKQQLFRGDYIEKGHKFYGYVAFSDKYIQGDDLEELRQIVENILTEPGLRLGNGKSSGYGAVKITLEPGLIKERIPFALLSSAERKSDTLDTRDTSNAHGTSDAPAPLNMLCLSNLCMLNEYGEPCGINEQELAEILNCEKVSIVKASSSVTHICSFNRMAGGRSPEYPVYEAGSIFQLECTPAPNAEALQKVEENGLGILTREGLGRILFIRNMESISIKEKCSPAFEDAEKETFIPEEDMESMTKLCALSILQRRLEQSMTQYVLNYPFEKGSASKSQRGSISALCKSLRYRPEDSFSTFEGYFKHIEDKENSAKTHRTRAGSQLTLKDSVMNILKTDLFELLGQQKDSICGLKLAELIDSERQLQYKLQLIEEMIRYANRKEKADV